MSSRKRKRIAAATLTLVAVFGLGVAGYIQATRASGADGASDYVYSNGTAYRLNHQRGSSGEYQWSGISARYAHAVEEASTQLENNGSAGSNEPENSSDEEQVAATEGKTNAYGAGAGANAIGNLPSGGPGKSGGDSNDAPPTLRLAGNYKGYAGGNGGGGAGPGNNQSGNGNPPPPSNNEQPKGNSDTQPADTQPTDEGKPGTPDTNPPPSGPNPPQEEPKPDEPREHIPDPTPPNNDPVSVPEPATLGLFGLGIAAMGFMRRRRGSAS